MTQPAAVDTTAFTAAVAGLRDAVRIGNGELIGLALDHLETTAAALQAQLAATTTRAATTRST